jgi:hypothetical protein
MTFPSHGGLSAVGGASGSGKVESSGSDAATVASDPSFPQEEYIKKLAEAVL